MSRNWGIPVIPLREAPRWYDEIAWQVCYTAVLIGASFSVVFLVIALRHLARMVFPHA